MTTTEQEEYLQKMHRDIQKGIKRVDGIGHEE